LSIRWIMVMLLHRAARSWPQVSRGRSLRRILDTSETC
jgi:hypothetical protein